MQVTEKLADESLKIEDKKGSEKRHALEGKQRKEALVIQRRLRQPRIDRLFTEEKGYHIESIH